MTKEFLEIFLQKTNKVSKDEVDNIKTLFSVVKDKQAFIELVHTELKCSTKPQSMRTNWFAGFFAIPDKHKPRIIELLQNTIKQGR